MTKNVAANRVIAKVCFQPFSHANSLCFWRMEILAGAVTDVRDVELKKLVTLASEVGSTSVQMWT
jgi:hypothetical protein